MIEREMKVIAATEAEVVRYLASSIITKGGRIKCSSQNYYFISLKSHNFELRLFLKLCGRLIS